MGLIVDYPMLRSRRVPVLLREAERLARGEKMVRLRLRTSDVRLVRDALRLSGACEETADLRLRCRYGAKALKAALAYVAGCGAGIIDAHLKVTPRLVTAQAGLSCVAGVGRVFLSVPHDTREGRHERIATLAGIVKARLGVKVEKSFLAAWRELVGSGEDDRSSAVWKGGAYEFSGHYFHAYRCVNLSVSGAAVSALARLIPDCAPLVKPREIEVLARFTAGKGGVAGGLADVGGGGRAFDVSMKVPLAAARRFVVAHPRAAATVMFERAWVRVDVGPGRLVMMGVQGRDDERMKAVRRSVKRVGR